MHTHKVKFKTSIKPTFIIGLGYWKSITGIKPQDWAVIHHLVIPFMRISWGFLSREIDCDCDDCDRQVKEGKESCLNCGKVFNTPYKTPTNIKIPLLVSVLFSLVFPWVGITVYSEYYTKTIDFRPRIVPWLFAIIFWGYIIVTVGKQLSLHI